MAGRSWMVAAAVLVASLLVGALAVAGDVTVAASQQAYKAGDVVTVQIDNQSGQPIFVPGCHAFELEEFREDRYVRVSRMPCPQDQTAQMLPTGTSELTTPTTDADGGKIYRISMIYGWGCNEERPLTRARCADFATARSASFRIGR